MAVDIVIPIFNAFEATKACVESVLRFTPAQLYRLLLVDDCSTDPRIRKFLEVLPAGCAEVLGHETNRGFVAAANTGMRFSRGDVVLLNSDTEVTPGWLEKLLAAAASRDNAATVTPLSNNGTICSVPRFAEDNPLPAGYSPERFAALIDRTALHELPRIPTGVGFCMFIRRKALDLIGFFDEDAFERGYGEENDFCYRAERAGFVNLLCDDAFVFHKGTASFEGKEKDSNIEKHIRVLEERYPAERRETLQFIKDNPLLRIHANLDFFLPFDNERRSILMVLHMPVPYRSGDAQAGGTQKHVLELANALKNDHNVFVLWPEKEGLCLVGFSGENVRELFFPFHRLSGATEEEKVLYCFDQIITAFSIRLVHIHHVLNLSKKLFAAAKDRGLPLVFTAHDFYMLCPGVNLMRDGVYCGGDFMRCGGCGAGWPGWLSDSADALRRCDTIIAPDDSTAELFQRAIPELDVTVVPHGLDTARYSLAGEAPARRRTERVNIGFVGMVNELKGSRTISALIAADTEKRYRWHIFGRIEDPSFRASGDNITVHGGYQGQDIPKLLHENDIRLCCILPAWPETFNYVLSECWLASVPVLAYDIGAPGGRIRAQGGGWLVPFNEPAENILRKIDSIMADTAGYGAAVASLEDYRPQTVGEMASRYRTIYKDLIKASKPAARKEYDRALIADAAVAGMRGSETLGLAYGARLEHMRGVLHRILPAPLAKRVLEEQYPFKKQLKRLAARVSGLLGKGRK